MLIKEDKLLKHRKNFKLFAILLLSKTIFTASNIKLFINPFYYEVTDLHLIMLTDSYTTFI
ncbi:MAG: hypothetical protein ACTSQ1_02055 [Promethearchaeota archaeon]